MKINNPLTDPPGGKVEKGEVKILSSKEKTGKISLPSCVAPVQLDSLNPTVLRPVREVETLDVPIELVLPHRLIKRTYRPKNLRYMMITMQVAGQLEVIDVVKIGGKYYIVDGLSRFIAADKLGFKTIRVRVLDLSDKEVKALRAHKNVKTKRPISEQAELMNLMLESLGSSQGKKRNLEDILKLCDDMEIPEKVQNISDRFEIVKSVLDLDMSTGTIRKLVKLQQLESEGTEEVKNLGLLKKIDSGEMSIDAAFNLMKNFNKSDDERNKPNALEEVQHFQGGKNWFKLINKTCEDLSDLDDKSIQTVIFSPPYWFQREYTIGVNHFGLKLGEEPTPELYVKNMVRICSNLKRVLKKDGNLFINVAESYSDGVCASVISKLIVAMEKDGWYLVQNIIWKKSNPKPVGGQIKRLRPSTEVILNFALDKKDRLYRPFRLWDRDSPIKLQGGCNDEIKGDKKQKKKKYSLDKPVISLTDFLDDQVVAGVISGSVVNKSQLKKIDSGFNHIAPSPEYISAIPVLTTTRPGDTVLDLFAGTSSMLSIPLRFKRNVIGFDTDPRSIEFSKKRLQSILDEQFSDSEIKQIDFEYFKAA